MKGKKLILMALAVVLTLSLAVPAILAAGQETVINGGYEEIIVDVVLMPTRKAQLNPYSMPVKALDTQATPAQIDNLTLKTAGKIATQPLVMYNKTDVALSVGATVSAENVTGIELLTSNVAPTSTDKQAQIYLEAMQDFSLNGNDYTVGADADVRNVAGRIAGVDGRKVVAAFNAWRTTTYDRNSTNQIIVNPDEPTRRKNIAVMNAGTGFGPNAGSYVLYRLGGDCSEAPDTAWAPTDKFDVKIAFSFTPTTDKSQPVRTGAEE